MDEQTNITNNDTLPFTNRFNYVVREVEMTEFQGVLTQIEEDEERESKTAFLLYKLGCFTHLIK